MIEIIIGAVIGILLWVISIIIIGVKVDTDIPTEEIYAAGGTIGPLTKLPDWKENDKM